MSCRNCRGAARPIRHPAFFITLLLAAVGLATSAGAQIIGPPEPIPGLGLELSQSSILLTKKEPVSKLQVEVTWADADIAEIPFIEWTVDDPSVVQVEKENYSGTSVSVLALAELGSTMIHASFGGARVSASVAIAELKSGVKTLYLSDFISVEQVFDEETEQIYQDLTLVSNPRTRAIGIGDLVISRGATSEISVLTRIVQYRVAPFGQIAFRGTLASLEEVYEELELRAVGTTGQDSIPLESSARAAEQSLLDFICSTSSDLVEISVTGPSVTFPQRMLDPFLEVFITGGRLRGFDVGVEADLSLEFEGPRADITAGLFFTFDCKVPLLGLVPAIPMGSTPFEFATGVSLGLEGEAELDLATISLTSGGYELDFFLRGGWSYDHDLRRWSKISERIGPTLTPVPGGLDAGLDVQLEAELGPYLRTDFGIGPLGLSWLAKVNLFSLKGLDRTSLQVPWEAIWYSPVPPDMQYQSPHWSRDRVTEGWIEVSFGGLGGMVLQNFLNSLAPDIPRVEFESPVLFTVTENLGGTPNVTASASPSSPAPGSAVTLSVSADPFDLMQSLTMAGRPVEFWASRDGGAAQYLGQTVVDYWGNGSISWTPTVAGDYQVVVQVYDWVTGLFSLPVVSQSLTVNVGTSAPTEILVWAEDWAFECVEDPHGHCQPSFYANDGTITLDDHSVRFDAPGGLFGNTRLWAPSSLDLGLDASGATHLHMDVRVDQLQSPPPGWQDPFTVELHTTTGGYILYTASPEPRVEESWVHLSIPLAGGTGSDGITWTRQDFGAGDLSNINWIEFEVDQWAAPAVKIWYDQIYFD